jgi:hypothetical protein
MKYENAIGFIIVKLNGHKMRLTDFRLKKIVGRCDSIDYSNASSGCFDLKPGRYAIVPFTQEPVARACDYIIHVQFSLGALEFEIENILEERPTVTSLSDDEESDIERDDDDYAEHKGNAKHMSDRRAVAAAKAKIRQERIQMIPPLNSLQQWEYDEDTVELGIVNMYEEIFTVCGYIKSLRAQLKDAAMVMSELRDEFAEFKTSALQQPSQHSHSHSQSHAETPKTTDSVSSSTANKASTRAVASRKK